MLTKRDSGTNWIRFPKEFIVRNHIDAPQMFECTNCCKYIYEIFEYCPYCGVKRGNILDYNTKEDE